MSNPLLYLIRMVLFLVAVVALAYLLHTDLIRVFRNTPILDGVIVGVMLLGIFFVFRQVILLWPEVKWIRRFQQREPNAPAPTSGSLNLLAPMAAMLGERQDQIRLSPTATRALLDGIALGPQGTHAYFVHSFHLKAAERADVVAEADYGGPLTAVVGRDTMVGTQFHPEKSQRLGLKLIANFLRWKP